MNKKAQNTGHSSQNRKYYPKDSLITDSVICSKEVQKITEIDFPRGFLGVEIGPGGVLTPQPGLTVNLEGVSQNIVLLRDKIVNIGFFPVTITRGDTPVPGLEEVNLPLQEETDCPGVCPEDIAIEAPFQVEAVIIQPIPRSVSATDEVVVLDIVRFKIVLRTTITVVRPIINSKDGCFVKDVNEHRCETPSPRNIVLPVRPANEG